MLPILGQLLWKEFHELKWAVVATAAISLTLPLAYAFRDPELALGAAGATFFIYPILAATFFAARLAAGERVTGTAPFLAAIPVRPQWIALVKLFATALATLVPLTLLLAVSLLLRLSPALTSDRPASVEIQSWAISSVLSVHLTIFLGLLGLGAQTEVRAASRGLAGFLLWGFVALLTTNLAFSANHWQMNWTGLHGSRLIYASEPDLGGSAATALAYIVRGIGPPFDWLKAVSTPDEVIHDVVGPWHPSRFALLPLALVFLVAAFTARYPRALQITPSGPSTFPRRLAAIPFRTTFPVLAFIWKSLREMLPMSVGVLACSLLLSLLAALSVSSSDTVPLEARVKIGFGFFGMAACAAGFLLALLIGTGTFVSDLEPRLNTFWRSRPLSPAAWYWTKYFTGLLLIVSMLGIPAFISTLSVGGLDLDLQELLWLIPLWLVVYSLAVTATCLVRHTVHAAILSLGVTGLIFAAVEIVAGSAFRLDGPRAPVSTIAAAFLIAFLVSTYAGARAAITDTKVST